MMYCAAEKYLKKDWESENVNFAVVYTFTEL
jgi:hypothetical protein